MRIYLLGFHFCIITFSEMSKSSICDYGLRAVYSSETGNYSNFKRTCTALSGLCVFSCLEEMLLEIFFYMLRFWFNFRDLMSLFTHFAQGSESYSKKTELVILQLGSFRPLKPQITC